MSYRVATFPALHANLSATHAAVVLCRANIGRLALSEDERKETIERIRRQISELEAMILELTRPDDRRRSSPVLKTVRRAEHERPSGAGG